VPRKLPQDPLAGGRAASSWWCKRPPSSPQRSVCRRCADPPRTFAAGLPAPALRLEAAVDGGKETPVSIWAGVVSGVESVSERLGIASAAAGNPATLADGLAEMVAPDGPSSSPCCWSARRCPASDKPGPGATRPSSTERTGFHVLAHLPSCSLRRTVRSARVRRYASPSRLRRLPCSCAGAAL